MTDRVESASEQEYFRQGVEQFNTEQFFEAHESWEAIWLHAAEPDKTFLQGITQVSAAFHHFANGNRAGARTLLQRGLEKLAQFPADYRGVTLGQLREELRPWFELFAQQESTRQAKPKIEWV